ncbi:MAG: hypothetical protein RLZZ31_1207 [Actinomycetota bacterium]
MPEKKTSKKAATKDVGYAEAVAELDEFLH